jgi:hypothetical protein
VRLRPCLTQTEDYLHACQRYIEFNRVRTGMVRHPRDCAWSSYRANSEGRRDPWLTPYLVYLALDITPAARRASTHRHLKLSTAAPDCEGLCYDPATWSPDAFVGEYDGVPWNDA